MVGIVSLTIPEFVMEIQDFAFHDCTSLRCVTLLNLDCNIAVS